VNGGVFGPVEGATRATGGGRGGGSGDGSGGCVDPGYEDTDGPLPDLGRPGKRRLGRVNIWAMKCVFFSFSNY